MKIWAKTEEFSEGKYLVVRRDGTVPAWAHFVLAGTDPCAAVALAAYAAEARKRGWDDEYVASIEALACEFGAASNTADAKAKSDPWAGPHREDLPVVLRMMRREMNVRDLVDADGPTAADCAAKFANTENFKGFPPNPPMVEKKGGSTRKGKPQA